MNSFISKTLIFISVFFINLIIYYFFLLNIESLNFIDDTIFSSDAWLYSKYAKELLNSGSIINFLQIFKNYYMNYYNIYPLILSLLYFVIQDIYFVIIFNSIILTAIIFKLHDIIYLIFKKDFLYFSALILIFNPVIILSTIQPLKEIIIIYLSIILIYEVIYIYVNNFKATVILFLKFFFIIGLLFLLRFYQPLLILIPYIFFISLNKLNLIFKNNKNYFFIFIFGLISIVSLLLSENLYNFVNQFRLTSIYQANISNSNFLSINLNNYNIFWNFFVSFPYFFFTSLFEPIPFINYKGTNFLLNLYLLFNLVQIILILGNLKFINNLNKHYFLILLMMILPILFLSYCNVNLGTLVRIKSVFVIILSTFGLYGWLLLIKDKLFLKIDLLNKILSINKNLTISILFSILLIITLILRDLFIISEVNFDKTSDFFYFITFSISISAYILSNPTYELLNKYILKKDYILIKQTILECFYLSTILSLLIVILIMSIFGRSFLFDNNLILLISILNLPFASFVILGNVIISSKVDPLLANIGNLIVPTLCVLLIIFFNKNIFFEIIIGLVLGQILNFIYNLIVVINYEKSRNLFKDIISIKFKFLFKLKDNNYLYVVLLNFLCFSPIIISNVYFANLSDSYLTYWILTSKVIFLLFFFILGLININFLNTFGLLKNYGLKKNAMVYKKISIIIFNILVIFSILIIFSYKLFIYPIVEDFHINILNEMLLYLLIMPFFIHSFIFIKFITILNIKVDPKKYLYLFIIILINCILLKFSFNINSYIYCLFLIYLSIFLIINLLLDRYHIKEYIWIFLNFTLLTLIFFLDLKDYYMVLAINIIFIFDFKKIKKNPSI